MWIRYFVPEDGDDSSHPNVFNLNANGSINMKQIKDQFPIPGSFHFRYLRSVGNHTVWMDVEDFNTAVPPYQGSIYIKASRIYQSSESSSQNSIPSAPKTQALPQKPVTVEPHQSEKLLNLNDDTSFDKPNSSSANKSSSSPFFEDNNDLLGFTSAPQSAAPQTKTNSNVDLFGLETLQPTTMNSGRAPMSSGMNPMQSGMNSSFQGMGGGMPMSAQPPRGPSMNPMNAGMGAPRPAAGNYDPFGGLGNSNMQNNQYGQYQRRNF